MSYTLSVEFCFELYHTKFHLFNFTQENKELIMKHSSVYIVDQEEERMSDDKKYEIFLLWRFYHKSFIFISDLISAFQKGYSAEKLDYFYDPFTVSNREFRISHNEFEHIFSRNFKITLYGVDLESFLTFFQTKYTFKITVVEFLDISLANLVTTYDLLEKKVNKYFIMADVRKQEFLTFKEFLEVMNKIVPDETKWKVSDYFK